MTTNSSNDHKTKNSDVKKQNEDLPNIPSSVDKISTEKPTKKQIKDSSKLNDEGKTDNTDKESKD